MAVCLVTGGAGFIGSHLVEALVWRGHEVRVLDNFSTGYRLNLSDVGERITMVTGDLADVPLLYSIMRGVDWVFHQAALASVPRSVADPLATHRDCATGTLHVLHAAQAMGVRRVIYAASSSAYGPQAHLPSRESDATHPASPYAAAKLSGEEYCVVYHRLYGLETVRLRYFNVFGPRQPADSPYSAVIPCFLAALQEGRPPEVHGDGRQSRDFTFVSDVVAANLRAAEVPGVSGRVYNVGGSGRTTLLKLVALLNGLLGRDIPARHTEARDGDVRHSRADMSRARTELGWEPTVSVEEGLRRCLAWCRCRPGDECPEHGD